MLPLTSFGRIFLTTAQIAKSVSPSVVVIEGKTDSGGVLGNSRGQAIGVVPFKLRSAEGLNFTVPIKYVRRLSENLYDPMSLEQMWRSQRAPTTLSRPGSSQLRRKVLQLVL